MIEKYNLRRDSGLTKFLTQLKQYNDLEIFEQSISIWGLKLKCSSKSTPKSLKLLSALLKEILSIGEIVYTTKLPSLMHTASDGSLKVHKNENSFGFDFEFCTISILVMYK